MRLAHDEKPKPIEFFANRRSKEFPWQGAPPVSFVRQVQDAKTGKTSLEEVATVDLPAAKRSLIVFTDRLTGGRWETKVLADDLASIPVGAFALFNGLDTVLRCRLGDQILDLPPGLSLPVATNGFLDQSQMQSIVSLEGEAGSYSTRETEVRNSSLPVIIVSKANNEQKTLFQAPVQVAKDCRHLMLIFPPSEARPGAYRILTLVEYIRPQPIEGR